MATSILITSARILRPDFTLGFGDIYIEDGRIAEIGKVSVEAEETIDATNKLAMPGLVNLHTHSGMGLLRGANDDLELAPWLERLWKIEAKLTPELVYWGSMLSLLEMIKTGTTTFLDMYQDLDQTAKACEDLGIRGFLAWPIVDEDKTTQKGKPLDNAKKFIKDWKNHELVTPGVGPHAIYSCNPENLARAKDLADKEKTFIHMHLAETRWENETTLETYGKRPVPLLDSIGFLDDNDIFAHGTWVTKNEIQTLAKAQVKIAHCPTSNMKLATGGVMPWKEMKEAKLTVGLGTDSVVSNNNLDMFEEMKFAALLQKAHRWDQAVLNAKEALQMATLEGAKALGLDYGLEEGRSADLVLVDLRSVSMVPHHDLISNLVYSASGSVVTHTVVNGKLVMKDRKVEGEKEIIEQALKLAQNFLIE